jgi:hypothetical protein
MRYTTYSTIIHDRVNRVYNNTETIMKRVYNNTENLMNRVYNNTESLMNRVYNNTENLMKRVCNVFQIFLIKIAFHLSIIEYDSLKTFLPFFER